MNFMLEVYPRKPKMVNAKMLKGRMIRSTSKKPK